MLRSILAALILCALATGASAHVRHHYRHHARHHHVMVVQISHGGLSHERLADGQIIVVATAYADRFVGFLNALFHREGHLPEIGCYSPTGHMRGSLHHWGGACDIGQRARNVAWRPMYHIGELAAEFGLTDGCIWRHPDCGHVDVSGLIRRRYAAR